jgi:hypothetical protein
MSHPDAEVLRTRGFQGRCIGTPARNADVVEDVPSALSSSSRAARGSLMPTVAICSFLNCAQSGAVAGDSKP